VHVVLPPNFQEALQRGKVLIVLEGVSGRDRAPLDSFVRRGSFRLADEAQRWKTAGKDIADFPEVAKDTSVAQIKVSLGTSLSQFASITNRYGPKHPQYKALASAVASDRQKLQAEALRAFNSMQASVDLEKANLEGARKKATAPSAPVAPAEATPSKKAPIHKTDEKSRQIAQLATAAGFTNEQTARLLSIGETTLKKHYPEELSRGTELVTLRIAQNLVRIATQTQDTKAALTACIFWLKCRGGFNDGNGRHEAVVESSPTGSVKVTLRLGDRATPE
jgi:hypothetical protein